MILDGKEFRKRTPKETMTYIEDMILKRYDVECFGYLITYRLAVEEQLREDSKKK